MDPAQLLRFPASYAVALYPQAARLYPVAGGGVRESQASNAATIDAEVRELSVFGLVSNLVRVVILEVVGRGSALALILVDDENAYRRPTEFDGPMDESILTIGRFAAIAPLERRFSPEDTTLKYKMALLSRAYFAVTGLAVLGLALMLAYRSFYQHPVVYCEKDSVDFGDVYAGQLLSQTFVLKNRGGRPLDLHLKTTSCSCIDPKIEPTRDGALLSVKLVMPQHQKDVEGFVTIETNDPGQPLKRFVVRARALNFFQVSPQSVNFGNIDITKASSEAKEITVSADPEIIEGISFKVEDIVSPSPVHFQVSRSADRTSLRLKVLLDKDLAIGPLTAKVFLMHSQKVIKPTLIPIRGIVKGKVRSDPVEVFLDVPEGTDVLRSIVTILPAENLGPLKIEDAHVLGELAARCQLSVSNDGGRPSCTFVLEPGRVADRSQLVRDIVQIRTSANIQVNVPIILSYH